MSVDNDPSARLDRALDAGSDRNGAEPDDAMQSRTVPLDDVFARVSRQLLAAHPRDERGHMLHSAGLKTAGLFYAFTTKGALVVKLPAARVDELIATGAGQPCAPRTRRPMREWVRLTPADEDACAAHVVEARTFVAAQATPSPANPRHEPIPIGISTETKTERVY